jgi:PTS system mannose-specific IIC component
MNSFQFILILIIAMITGMGSVMDCMQTHQPIVACTLVGLALGDVKTGVILGGTLQLLALGWMNVGAAMAPDGALASVVSTILVIVGHQSIAAGIAVAIPIAAAGQVLTIFVRTITIFFQHLSDKYAEEANFRGIEMCHVVALLLQGLRIAIPAALVAAVAGTSGVQSMLAAIPVPVTRGLQIAGGMIVVVGYAMVINMMEARYLMPFFFVGYVLAAFTTFSLVGFGIIGVCAAIFYIQLSPKYNQAQVVDELDEL